jgi:hypothetical protein
VELESFVRGQSRRSVPDRDIDGRAAEWAADARLKLRTGDALHLAIASHLDASKLVGLDDVMIAGEWSLGLSVHIPNRRRNRNAATGRFATTLIRSAAQKT